MVNYRRWIIVGFVGALALFSFCHLSMAGSDYKVLTTSDSGFFYGIAQGIDDEDGMINVYELSHGPQGVSVAKKHQFQPLMLVTLYRGLHAVDSSVQLEEVMQYFSPFLFSVAMIGAFLAARELGGDLAGCASALFFSTLVGSVYWAKIGAFDREISLVFFGTWLFYLSAKLFSARGRDLFKYIVFTGIVYGMFLVTWTGAQFLLAIIALAVVLVLLERAVSGLGFVLSGGGLLVLGQAFSGFDVPELIGIFVLLAGVVKVAMDLEAVKKIESNIISTIMGNLLIIGASVGMLLVASLIAVVLGGYSPDFWVSFFTNKVAGFVGLGGGGVSFPRVATEMAAGPSAPEKYVEFAARHLYGSSMLTGVTVSLVFLGVMKVFWSSKRRNLLAIAWLLIIVPMPLAQSRFVRLFWPVWPILAGFGLGSLVWMVRGALTSPTFSTSAWLDKVKQPIVLAIVAFVFIVPFVQNVRADQHTSDTRPYPHGSSLPTVYYQSLLDSFNWVEDNTSENSLLVVPWSYGHFASGATGRPTITDGAQKTGWRGEWENSPGVKPPDYIKYVSGGEGYIVGKNTSAQPYQINGRRIDVQRMITMGDENEFAWLVNAYREGYGVDMDYMIFNNYVSGQITAYQGALFSLSSNLETTDSWSQYGGGGAIFQFKEENIIFTFQGVPATQDNEKLGGVVYYNVESNRLLNYSFESSPDKGKILWVFFNRSFQIQGAGLADYDGIPMLIRALDDLGLPDYLREVYRSPHGQAVVCEIVHENIPRYLDNL